MGRNGTPGTLIQELYEPGITNLGPIQVGRALSLSSFSNLEEITMDHGSHQCSAGKAQCWADTIGCHS